jgi:regulator of protease activity HflC (stomatin/prohibitin superfamily)
MVLLIVLFALLLVLIGGLLAVSLRVVHPEHQAVIERFGRYRKTVRAGMCLQVPFIHTRRLVDMREQVLDLPTEALSRDQVLVGIDASVFYACVDARTFVYEVADVSVAMARVVETGVRSLVAGMTLPALLAPDHDLAERLSQELRIAAGAWGVRISRVEIPRIDPPGEVLDAMTGKAMAEWVRDTQVIEAEQEVRASTARAEAVRFERIREAEASRHVAMLQAESEAAATRVLADADRYRVGAQAEAQAEAIRAVSGAMQEGWALGDSAAIKYLEVTGRSGLLEPFASLPGTERAKGAYDENGLDTA